MQTRASDEGPSAGGPSASGSGGRSRLQDSNFQERDASKFLRGLAKKHDIVSTTSLVAAYNATRDRNERNTLLGWLRKYVRKSDECLKPEFVLEYAELAKVVPVFEQDADVLRKLVYDLSSLIRPGEFLNEDVAKALFSALTWTDSAVYNDTAQLTDLGLDLLLSLSSKPRLTKQNFLKYEANFLCIHQVLFLLQSIGRGHLLEEEKKEFRREIAKKKEEMERSSMYYPVSFHFELIQQAVERLETRNAPSILTRVGRCLTFGLYLGMHAILIFGKLARCDIDCTSIEDAYRKGRAAIANAGVLEREWYDILQILTAARLRAHKEEQKCELLVLAYDTAMEGQHKAIRKNEQKALRCGIIHEMRLLAQEKDSSQDGRKEATTKLLELTTNQAISDNWIRDADILIEILDALHMVHSLCEQNQEIAEAIRKIQRSCDERAKRTFTAWLDGNTLEEKLRMQRQEVMNEEHEDMFTKISADIQLLRPSIIPSNIEDLKRTYLNNFAAVPSLFESDVDRHVKDMEFHVVVYAEIIEARKIERREEHYKGDGDEIEGESSTTQKRDNPKEYCEQKKVATPVSIEDLFKPRSLEAGVVKSDIQRVLLYGNPGTGKTCIGKSIAYKWASGEILQDFEAIYVVPIRRLNIARAKGVRGEALEEVVAHTCFTQKGSDVEFEELKAQVNDDLHMSSTLLIFDGLDEADDDARELIFDAERRSCRLLILTRPYNLRRMQERVDIQFECLGFDDEQLRNFIRKELDEDEASKILKSLVENQAMWEMVHVPVLAHILCTMSKQKKTTVEGLRKKTNMFRIYNDMANCVWKRFEDKPQLQTTVINKVTFFNDLEEIAFEALRTGQTLIEETIVISCTTLKDSLKIMKNSGFLLRALEEDEYQFSHKTFQEFFAGRYIARYLLKKETSSEKIRVERFFRRIKYTETCELTLFFVMHAFAEACGKDALDEMLSILDEQPVEILGIQHLFLRMRVLEACLEEAYENDLGALLKDEEALKLTESAQKLSVITIDNAPVRQILVEKFALCCNVLEQYPKVFGDIVEETRQLLASERDLKNGEKAKIRDVLKLAERSPKHRNDIDQWRLQLTNTDRGWCRAIEGDMKRKVTSVPSKALDKMNYLLSMLERDWSYENSNLHWKAKAIGRFLALQPHEFYDMSMMMWSRCTNIDIYVRQKAMKTIGSIIEIMPQNASDLLPMLERGCSDENSDVCEAAKRTLNSIKPDKIILKTIASRSAYEGGLLLLFVLKAFTVEPLTRNERAAFLVHTTFPQEIGKWDRIDLERYVAHLRQEFGRKFPKLLDYLGTKEGTTRSKQPRRKKARGLLRFITPFMLRK